MLAHALALVCLAAAPAGGSGKVFLTVEEALALAFPECRIERATEFLSEAEATRAGELAHAPLASRVARPYRATKDGVLVGTAYFDAHRVRTKNAVLMLVVGPDERVRRVEVLAFAEPLEYLPKTSFYAQYIGRRLDAELDLKRGVRGVSGATLSAESATAAVRRTLALHHVLAERAPPSTVAAR
jgi:hypothetical protein